MSLVLLALACSTETSAPVAPGPDAPAPAAPAAPAVPEAPPDPIAAGDGAAYGDRWLIILSSKKELGHVPPGARKLLDDPSLADVELARLPSTGFKALQPCYEIVVAKAFTDRKEAVAFSKALTAQGIDNYPKNAGKWVGAQPRVEAYCRGESEQVDAACPSGLALAETDMERHFVALGLDPAVSEPALAGAPPPTKLHESMWVAPITAEKLGAYAVGDAWSGYAISGPPGECRIARFVAATRGVPHFGWEEGAQDTPGCGEPEVMAELTCEGVGEVLFASRPDAAPTRVQPGGEISDESSEAVAALETLKSNGPWGLFAKKAAEQAEDRELFDEVTLELYDVGGRALIGARGRWYTGEGWAECGGGDVSVEAWALVDPAEKKVLAGPMDVYGLEDVLPVDAGADGSWQVWTRDWRGTLRLHSGGPSGSTLCTSEFAYCDCPC